MYLILSFCVRSSRWYNIAKMNCDDYRWHNIVDGTFADKLQTSTPVEHPTFEVDIVEVIMWSLKLHAASFFDSKPSRAESRSYGKIWPWDESLDRRRFYMERFSRTSFHFLLVVLFSRQPSQPSRQARQPMHNTVFRGNRASLRGKRGSPCTTLFSLKGILDICAWSSLAPFFSCVCTELGYT